MAEVIDPEVEYKSHVSLLSKASSSMIPFARNSPTLLWENQEIFRLKEMSYYSIDGSNQKIENKIDFSHDIELMKLSTKVYGGDTVDLYEQEYNKFCTEIIQKESQVMSLEVNNESCLAMARRYSDFGEEPLVMDLAERNAKHVCGSWNSYYVGSQEEAIERQSVFLRYALDPKLNATLSAQLSILTPGSPIKHHIPEYGALLVQHVPIIRDRDMRLSRDWWKCGVIAIGAPDLRLKAFRETDFSKFSDSSGVSKAKHYFSIRGAAPELHMEELRLSLKRKIRISLVAAVSRGYLDIVLGALGCGAYRNPIDEVATCFAQVLGEKEFRNNFRRVGFAVLGDPTFSLFRQYFMTEWEAQNRDH
ncbi:hypothetical protein LOD99_15975 [Oopsacas minuta]|uniref:Microbial-type PARG catalytic domain-containing protein n=1 Tax=Oopsacas minuta TaxID=111878 RepID=A0AAV7K947_9METZ|nr:hypothetical protein LOD99_15975 [Oopsacas minuta]